MSVATLQQFGQSLSSWLALAQGGETVAIVDGGHEVARLVPPLSDVAASSPLTKKTAVDDAWLKTRMAELEEMFPEPVIGVSEALETFRAERF